jgi:glycosyltransferase involved in cell wall biosynthesis
VKIAIYAAPLVTRHITGIEQLARNIVAQWIALAPQHEFFILLEDHLPYQRDFDSSLIDALPVNFHITRIHPERRFSTMERIEGLLNRKAARPGGREPWDILHSFSPWLPRASVAPMVHTIHDLSCELDPHVRRTHEGSRQREIHRSAVRRASRTIAVSQQTRHDIIALYHVPPTRVHIIHNGINPTFTPDPDAELHQQLIEHFHTDRRYILMVGSDIPRRNYQRVWPAIERVLKTHPRLQLILAGRNRWAQTMLYHQISAAGYLGRVTFIESPSDKVLAQLYRDAMLTCCGSSFEGFGLSVLEAMACGCAVACSDMMSLRELAGDAVLYFSHDEVDSMAEAISSLADDPEFRRQLRQRGLQRSSEFTWEHSGRLLLSILEDTVTANQKR